MKLVTDRIFTGNGKRFEDYVQECVSKREVVKTASSAKEVVKTAEKKEKKDEGKSSGQLDVEPLHQEGESTTMPKAGPSAKKEDASSGKKEASEKKEKKDEAETSGQLKVEPLHQKGESTELPKNPKGNKAGDSAKDSKEASKSEPEKMCEKCGKPCGQCSCEGMEDKKDCSASEAKEDKKASTKQFVKIANLDSKNKTFLRKYWTQLFGSDYVDALLADK